MGKFLIIIFLIISYAFNQANTKRVKIRTNDVIDLSDFILSVSSAGSTAFSSLSANSSNLEGNNSSYHLNRSNHFGLIGTNILSNGFYIPLAGGVMTGNLGMSNQRISNVSFVQANNLVDVLSISNASGSPNITIYADDALNLNANSVLNFTSASDFFIESASDIVINQTSAAALQIHGDIEMNSKNINSVNELSASGTSLGIGPAINIVGTGTVSNIAPPTASNHAATKFYVDSATNNMVSDLTPATNYTDAATNTLRIFITNQDRITSNSLKSIIDSATNNIVNSKRESIWVPAGAMLPSITNGSSSLITRSSGVNTPNISAILFDSSSDEHAMFGVTFPTNWDNGAITFKVYWTVGSAVTTGIAFALQGVALSDSGAIGSSYGTAVVITDDALNTANDLHISSESGNVTIGGTPSADDLVFFRVFRDVSDANDDMTQDMELIGIRIFFDID